MCGINLSLRFGESQEKVYMTKRVTNALAYEGKSRVSRIFAQFDFKKALSRFYFDSKYLC